MKITHSLMTRHGFSMQSVDARRRYIRQYDDRLCVVIYEANDIFYFEHQGGVTYLEDEAHLMSLYYVLTGIKLDAIK